MLGARLEKGRDMSCACKHELPIGFPSFLFFFLVPAARAKAMSVEMICHSAHHSAYAYVITKIAQIMGRFIETE